MSTPEKFIEDVYKKAKKNDIQVKLVDSKLIYAPDDPLGCSGYFDEDARVLCVSTKRSKRSYYGLLAHESSHMDQFINDRYLWDKCNPGYSIFFQWLGGSIVKQEHLIESVQDIIRIELDCERRAIKKLIKYNLPLDIQSYIKSVNAYLYGYLFSLETRAWFPQIYEHEDILNVSSTKLKKSYQHIPQRLHRAYRRQYKTI